MMKQMAGQFGFGGGGLPALPDLSKMPPGLNELPPGLAGLDQLPPGFDPSRLKLPKSK
jgi:signal recognition particle subunit SRP54